MTAKQLKKLLKKSKDPYVQAQLIANQSNKEIQQLSNKSSLELQKLADATTQKTFEFNKQEAATARDWQKEMSDTSHQREVEDLKKAGLNPVLSANSGAQSYTTSSASAQATDATSAVSGIMGSAMQSSASRYSAAMNSAANKYASDRSYAAQLRASQQQAAAQRYAAIQAASAQRYAADRNAEVQKYKADKDLEGKKFQTLNQRPNNIVGMFDKILEKYKLYGKASDSFKKGIEAIDKVHDNEKKYKVNPNLKFTYDNTNKAFKLGKLDPMLQKLGQPSTDAKRKVIFNAFYKHNALALAQVAYWYRQAKKPKTSSRYNDNYHVNPY